MTTKPIFDMIPLPLVDGEIRTEEDLVWMFGYIERNKMLKLMSSDAWVIYKMTRHVVERKSDYKKIRRSKEQETALLKILRGDNLFIHPFRPCGPQPWESPENSYERW